jgi:hypothetical protein
MIQKLFCLKIICILLSATITTTHAQNEPAHSVSAKITPEGYTLSINSHNLPLGRLLQALSEQCQLRVITHEEAMTSQPVTISFKDVPLDQGIKRLLKAAGINNYFIQYRNDEKNRSSMAAVTLLGKGTKESGAAILEDFTKRDKEKEGIRPLTGPLSPEDEFAEKVTALKERYEWADEETKELAGHLLELMPQPARGSGVEELMKALDRKIATEVNDTVDEKIFFQALEDTAPSHLAPVMMDSIKHYTQGFREGATYEKLEQSPNELYQEVMSKKSSHTYPEGR